MDSIHEMISIKNNVLKNFSECEGQTIMTTDSITEQNNEKKIIVNEINGGK